MQNPGAPWPAPAFPANPNPGPRSTQLLWLAVLLIGTAAAYAPVFSAGFVFDDFINITDNPCLPRHRLDLGRFLSTLSQQPNPSRPLAYLSFSLNFILFGPGPKSFHLANLAIHLFATLVLFALVKSLGARMTPSAHPVFALSLAALWALHPVNTEAASYIVQRMTSMAGLFYLCALLAYVHLRTATASGTRIAAFIALALSGISACATKETSYTLPVFLLLLEYFFFYQPREAPGQARTRLWLIGLTFLVSASAIKIIYLFGPRTLHLISRGYSLREFTLAERLLTETRVLFYYLFLSWFPAPHFLRLQYDFSLSHGPADPPSTVFALLGLAGIAVALARGIRQRRLWAFLILWFLGQLAIESSVLPLELLYEHRLYLPLLAPMAGFLHLALGSGQPRKLRLTLVAALALLFGTGAYLRNQTWADPQKLWRDSVSKAPGQARTWANLGQVYRNRGELDRARKAYQRAARIAPKFTDAWLNLSGVLSSLGQGKEARATAERALALEPRNPRVLLAMGEVESEAGNAEQALIWYEQAEQISPDRPGIHLLIGNSYFHQGRFAEAAAAYGEELKHEPDSPEAHNNLGMAWLRLSEPGKARDAFARAAALAPGVGLYQGNWCEAEFDLGSLDRAEASCRQAVALDSSLAFAWKKLGEILGRRNRKAEAIGALERAARLAPEDREIIQMLEQAKAEP